MLIDLWDRSSTFHEWAAVALDSVSRQDVLVINPIIWTELVAQVVLVDELDRRLALARFRRLDLPWGCLPSAARAFVRHCEARRRSGAKVARTPLPDFFIGAHAEWAGFAVITRDAARFRTYFPSVKVVAPEPLA